MIGSYINKIMITNKTCILQKQSNRASQQEMHVLGTKVPVIFRTNDLKISDIHKRKQSLVFDTNHASSNMFVKRKQKTIFQKKKAFRN